jgi:hypothetical protein
VFDDPPVPQPEDVDDGHGVRGPTVNDAVGEDQIALSGDPLRFPGEALELGKDIA